MTGFYPSTLAQVGIGRETTFGTPQTPVAALVTDPPAATSVHDAIPDAGWRTSPASQFGHTLGATSGTVSLSGPCHADHAGWALAGVLGDVSATGSNRVNLCPNPSFETDTHNWSASVFPTLLSRDTTQHYVGAASLSLFTQAGTANAGGYFAQPVTSGTYTLSAYLRVANTLTVPWWLGIRWLDASGTLLSTSWSASSVQSPTAWTRLSVTATPPAGAVTAQPGVYPQATTGGAADTVWVDAVLLEQSTTVGTYFDGNSTGAPTGSRYMWLGAVNDSASALAGQSTWTIALLNSGTVQPGSYTVSIADPVGVLAYPGGRFTRAVLTASSDGTLDWTGDLATLAPVAGSSLPPLYGSPQIPSWAGTCTLAGTMNTQVLDASVTLNRAVTPFRNTDGNRAAYQYRAGVVDVKGTATLLCTTDVWRQDVMAGSNVPITLDWSTGSGAIQQQVQVQMSQCVLTKADRRYDGQWIELDVAWTAEANSTDSGASGGLSPVKATLINTAFGY